MDKRKNDRLKWLRACHLWLALAIVPSSVLAAEPTPSFEVTCTVGASCPDIATRKRIESMTGDAWQRFAGLGFPLPTSRMSRRIDSSGPPTVLIEFCDPQAEASSDNCRSNDPGFLAYAHTARCTSDQSWQPDSTTIVIGKELANTSEPLAYYMLAHEVFHLFSMRATTAGRHLCEDAVPMWVTEGIAVFGGYWATEQHYGAGALQPAFNDTIARSYYGIRPYQLPLTLKHGDYPYGNQTASTSLVYYTSSLWRYLAERFHDGSPGYLARYLATLPGRCGAGSRTQADCRSDAAWLTWLDARLQADAGIKRPLQELLPEFLAEFATWAPRRFLNLEESLWRETGFNGCRSLDLSPDNLEVSFEVEARMYAATCITVTLDGVPAGDVVAIEVIAEDASEAGSPIWVDGTRLGVAEYGAALDDPIKPLNCFEVRAITGSGDDTCLVQGHPRTDPGATTGGPRRQNVFRTLAQRSPGKAFENTLIITQTYRAPGSDASNEASRPMRFHLGLLMDHAAMGKTAAAVDAPVRIELDLVNVAQASIDRTPRAFENAGENACTFVLHAKKRSTQEMVTLHLNHRGPIKAGRYDIVDEGVGQNVPGQAVTHFAVRAGPAGEMLEFGGVGGQLVLSEITRSGVISGVGRIMGERKGIEVRSRRKKVGGPNALAIEAVFTATVRDPNRRIAAILDSTLEQDPLGSDCLVAGKL